LSAVTAAVWIPATKAALPYVKNKSGLVLEKPGVGWISAAHPPKSSSLDPRHGTAHITMAVCFGRKMAVEKAVDALRLSTLRPTSAALEAMATIGALAGRVAIARMGNDTVRGGTGSDRLIGDSGGDLF